jgi:sugar lactone lactonase YvrE
MRIAVITFCFFLLAGSAAAQEPPFTHYTPESELAPLPSADVRSIYQDRLGYIWFVIYSSGLLRYDGHSFDTYGVADGLTEPTVREVIEDSFGRLWVASNAGLMVSDRPLQQYGIGERIHFMTRIGAIELVHSAIADNRMALDQRGWFWVGTRENGIIRYHPAGLDSVSVDTIRTDISGAGRNRDIRSIAVRKDGSVYVGVGGTEILVFTSALPSYQILGVKDGTPAAVSTDVMFENRKGKLFGGCRNGIFWQLIEASGARARIAVIDTELHSRISSILEEHDGTLWISSSGSGAMKIDNPDELTSAPIRRSLYTRRNGLLGENVNDLLIDREGNIWFAQSGGGH